MGTPPPNVITTPRRPLFQQWRFEANDLISEIAAAAEQISAARTADGECLFKNRGPWRVLRTVARSHYCLAIADLARALGVRKQVAHGLAHEAERVGFIELTPNPHDRRILQALITPRGRAELTAAQKQESIWLATLLNGLGRHEMMTTTNVLRVIR